MKTTNRQFERFKELCRLWQEKLGLTQYSLYFERSNLGVTPDDSVVFGQIDADEMGKTATISILKDCPKDCVDDFNIENIARHEMLHLLSNRFYWLSIQRYLNPSDLNEEWEALTRRLENLTKDMIL